MIGPERITHVEPVKGREHLCEGTACWCAPDVLEVCDECPDEPSPDCWKCAGAGTVPCSDPESYDGPHGLIIVHHFSLR